MGETERFYVIFEKHFGLGVRWELDDPTWKISISIGIPFVSFVISFGKKEV